MYKFSKLFISLFGIGFFPYASGTIGTIASLLLLYLIIEFVSFFSMILIFTLIFFISIKLINNYTNFVKKHDSSEIIIDEFLGIVFIFIFYDFIKFTNNLTMFIIIFLIFRFFDILKPFPINWIDKNIKNSFGVLLDDIIAGTYTVIFLLISNVFI